MYGEIDKTLEHKLVKGMIGNLTLDVDASSAKVSVVTDTTELRVRIFTRDTSGPAVEAVRESVIQLQGDTLKIYVPPKNASCSSYGNAQNMVVNGNVGIMSHGGISGNVVFGGHTSQGVEVEVDIPAAHIKAVVKSGSLIVVGRVETLVADIKSGSLKADKTHHLNAKAASGSIKIEHVTGHAKVSTPSGTVRITEYSGNHLEASASSGTINIGIGAAATGTVDLKASSGTIKVSGAHANSNVRVTAKASSGTTKIY